jgi:hypothetical protein
MTVNTPAKRLVACRILTYAGWLEGAIRVAPRVVLIEHLNRPEQLYRLVDVKLPGQTVVLPFFALTRSSTVAVVPMDAAEMPQPVEGRKAHKTVWLLHDGIVVEGMLDLLEGVRVSDHLAHRTGFVALHDCTVYMPNSAGPTTVFPRVPFLALQTDRAIGTSELEELDPNE